MVRAWGVRCPDTCPEFEGIETEGLCRDSDPCRPDTCPEFEGIETMRSATVAASTVVRTLALNSKGLRPLGIAEGLCRDCPDTCPEFEGIETQVQPLMPHKTRSGHLP